MIAYDWRAFLGQWSSELLASPDVAGWHLPPGAIERGWAGYAGASEDQIAAAEWRLGVYLPPSYREFLKVSNGWPAMGNPFSGGLLAVEGIERFPARNGEWLRSIRALPETGEVDFAYPVSDEAFENAIEICETREGTLLLNPLVIDANGEMEAWFFEGEMGVERHASFWALMQAEYKLFQYLEQHR